MEQPNSDSPVLVTGATGYLAGHVIYQLLEQGYKVRGTVRSLSDKQKNAHLLTFHPKASQNLQLVEANLLNEANWAEVVRGCDYVLHVASPFPSKPPKEERDVIEPALNGTTNVMNACVQNGVKKIVLTSSIAAIMTGVKDKNHFKDTNWSDPKHSPPYEKSKHLAEKKAWEIYEQNKDKIQLSVICPGWIQGPCFHKNAFTSGDLLIRVFNDDMPATPEVSFGMVDVRDVALAHIKCIQMPDETNAKRYILVENSFWLKDIISIIKDEFGKYGYKVPSLNAGKVLLTMTSWFDSQIKLLLPYVGRFMTFDNQKSQTELGIVYHNMHKTIVDMGYDLIQKGVVKDKTKKK